MNRRIRKLGTPAIALALALACMSAQASRVPGPMLQGRVTAVSTEWLAVDGRRIRVKPGSPAAEALRRLHVGQEVTLGLDGAADSSATKVVVIQAKGPSR